MKFKKYFAIALALNCCILSEAFAQAKEAPQSVEALMANQKWTQASRAIFEEAIAADPKNPSIAEKQAQAGFLEDAIANTKLQFPVSKTPLFLKIAKLTPHISPAKKLALIQLAVESSSIDVGQNYLRSGDWALLSLVFVEMEQVQKAKAAYQTALDLAAKGLSDQSNGGYRRVTEELAKADAKFFQEWMTSPLLTLINKSIDDSNAAFAYLDLARLQHRMQQPDAIKAMLNLGMARAQKMPSNGLKTHAINQLANFALEVGDAEFAKRYGDQTQLLPSYALYEGEKGNRTEALALTSKLGSNLYVNWKAATQAKLISNAIKRRDMNSVIFYIDQFTDLSQSDQIHAWTQIAELQISQGDRETGLLSYRKAQDSFSKKTEHEYFAFEIMTELALGKSMFQHGFKAEGSQVISSAIHHSRTIPRRRMQDRISIKVRSANALTLVKRTAEAKKLIVDAYQEAHNYPQDQQFSKMNQASLLSEIALVITKLGAK